MTTEPTTDETTTAAPNDVRVELGAMRKIVALLDALNPAAQDRVVAWVWSRYTEDVIA